MAGQPPPAPMQTLARCLEGSIFYKQHIPMKCRVKTHRKKLEQKKSWPQWRSEKSGRNRRRLPCAEKCLIPAGFEACPERGTFGPLFVQVQGMKHCLVMTFNACFEAIKGQVRVQAVGFLPFPVAISVLENWFKFFVKSLAEHC